jgi:hypothetical protein
MQSQGLCYGNVQQATSLGAHHVVVRLFKSVKHPTLQAPVTLLETGDHHWEQQQQQTTMPWHLSSYWDITAGTTEGNAAPLYVLQHRRKMVVPRNAFESSDPDGLGSVP